MEVASVSTKLAEIQTTEGVLMADLKQVDRDLRKRVIALSLERTQREEMVGYCDVQLSKDDCGPMARQQLLGDRQKNHDRVVAIIREMDEIHARRVELGLAS